MLAIVGLFLLIIVGTLALVFLAAFIPFLVLLIRRFMGRRSTAGTVWMIVLGVIAFLAVAIFGLIVLFIATANAN